MTQQGYIRPLTVKRLTVYPLSLRMKRKVSHAASERVVAQPIVVAVELENGMVGYGEALPRDYVTGETNETVLELLGPDGEFVKQLLAMRPAYFSQALEMIDSLPMLTEAGIPCPAARERWSWLYLTRTCVAATEAFRILSAGWGCPVSASQEALIK